MSPKRITLTDEEKRLMGEAVPLIYEHLWLGKRPPPSPDDRPWTVARDLSIWKILIRSNFKPEHVNGAISVVRALRPEWGRDKLRMTIFYGRAIDRETGREIWNPTAFLETCIAYHLDQQSRDDAWAKSLPKSVRSIMGGLVE